MGDQVIMGAPFDDAAVIEHHDAVRIHDGGQPVGDHKGSPALHQSIHTFLHQGFCTGVDGGGGFIQDHYRRIGYRRPGNGDQLPLALRKVGTVAGKLCIVAFRQAGDEAMGVGKLCRLDAFFVGGIQLAVADIIHHGAGEQVGILQHDTKAAAQVGLFNLVDIDAIVADLAVGNVVEPVDQVGDGGLARAGGSDEGDLLAGVGVKGHIVEYRLFRHIGKVYTVHNDIALQLGVGNRAVCLMGMLPGPVAGASSGFRNGAVGADVGIDQRHIPLVGLRLLVHQLKHTLRAGQCHDDGVDLVADLGDGVVESAAEQHEGHQVAQTQQLPVGGYRHDTAHNGENGILDIAQIVIHGAHHVAELSGGIGVPAQLLVQLVELFLADILVVEDLDHLLAVDHLLHIAVQRAQGALLTDEEFACLANDLHSDEQNAGHSEQDHQRQDPGGPDHGDEYHHQGDDGAGALGDGLGDHLPQGVDVTGIAGHNVARSVGIKVTQRKLLHFGKHLVPDDLLRTLADADHQKLMQEGGQHTANKDQSDLDQVLDQRAKVGRTGGHHGQDVIVYQVADVLAAFGLHQGGDHDTQQHHDQSGDVFSHIAQKPQQGLAGILGLAAVAAHSYGWHLTRRPPFSGIRRPHGRWKRWPSAYRGCPHR